MCLTVKEGEKIRIARRDILVYKLLIPRGHGRYITYFRDYHYYKGKKYAPVKLRIDGFRDVNEGFHAYVGESFATDALHDWRGEKVVPLIIPKGSQYILGVNYHIVSSHIRFPRSNEKPPKPIKVGKDRLDKGQRVKLIKLPKDAAACADLKLGLKGTIIRHNFSGSCVEWDGLTTGHSGTFNDDRKTCWHVPHECIKPIK